ncbi:ATP-grasp domain-containing protein [Euzebya pacifica]|nr:ATP-grasp domain-containing protein [Euzebya pacifica]
MVQTAWDADPDARPVLRWLVTVRRAGAMTPAALMVACHLRWVADDMRAGADGRFPVVVEQSAVFLPEPPAGEVAWWVTTGHAARLVQAGLGLRLDVVDDAWLAGLPHELTDRRIRTGVLEELVAWPAQTPGFVKPSLAKVDVLAAQWVPDIAVAARLALDAGAHPATSVQVSDVRLDLVAEHRVYVLDGRAVASSPYLVDGASWEPGWDAASRPTETSAARAFAEAAVASGPSPEALVVDVGLLASGRWVVVEANAPWASNPYGCDLRLVVDCVVAASCGRPASRWTWSADAHEAAIASTMDPLVAR